MLGLKFETSTSWVDIAKDNLEQILTDHAFQEQKASANAISIIINYSEETELVKDKFFYLPYTVLFHPLVQYLYYRN